MPDGIFDQAGYAVDIKLAHYLFSMGINGAAADDQMCVQYIFDGLQTRDVQ